MAAERTVQDLLETLPRYGDRLAVGLRGAFGLRWWRYQQLHQMSWRAAALLAEAGVCSGDAVLLRARNSPEWVAFFFGAALRGAVVVPLDIDATPAFVDHVTTDVEAKILVTSRLDPGVDTSLPVLDTDLLYGPEPPAVDHAEPVDADDPAIIFFTSGTTSEPRGVVLTHGNLMSQTARFRPWRWWVRMVTYRMVVVAPTSHVQGLVLGICIPLTVGLSVIYTHSSHPGHLFRTLRDNRVTLLSTVPRSLHMLARLFESRPYGRSGKTLAEKLAPHKRRFVRRHFIFTAMRRALGYRFWVMIVGGAPLPDQDERFWRDSGMLLIQGYGLTETTAVVSVTAPVFGGYGSVGRPLAHQDVRIAEDGEILVRGPNVTPRYHGDSDAGVTQSINDGYLHTGDLGRLDDRKRLYILGRKRDVIVTGEGFNVYAGDIEETLARCPGLRDSVVFGRDRAGHAAVHAVLLLERNAEAVKVVQQANHQLQEHQRIRSWSIWADPDFPRGSLLKVRRAEVIEIARATPHSATVGAMAKNELPTLDAIHAIEDRNQRLSLLARYIAASSDEPMAGSNRRLVEDLGLSSLDVVELLFLLEQQTGASLENTVVGEQISVGELGELVDAPQQAPDHRALDLQQPPRWAESSPFALVRQLLNPVVLGSWLRLQATVSVEGLEHLEGLQTPVVLAGIGHEHGMDVPLIYHALPYRFARRVALIAGRWVFGGYLDPDPDEPWLSRLSAWLGMNLAVPLFFPLALTPHFGTAREGLMSACRLIDRGYSPIVFEGQGIALIASQTGVPIVPVHLSGNQVLDFKPRLPRAQITVRFGPPLPATPDVSQETLMAELTSMFSPR